MTRETKIGLVVGLAFIIVIGVLVSDHLSSVTRPPQARFDTGSGAANKSTLSPGVARQGTDRVIQLDNQPEIRGRLGERPSPAPVRPNNNEANGTGTGGLTPIVPDGTRAGTSRNPNDVVEPIPGPGLGNGGNRVDDQPTTNDEPLSPGLARYKAVAGDTVSRLATKFMGSNTNANREKIISLNPSLKANPNKIVVGETYIVPDPNAARVVRVPDRAPMIPLVNPERTDLRGNPPTPREELATTSYTTRPGDTLWKIARDQCGSQSKQTVDQIKTLNQDVLKGKEILHPNLKLKIPTRAVATR